MFRTKCCDETVGGSFLDNIKRCETGTGLLFAGRKSLISKSALWGMREALEKNMSS